MATLSYAQMADDTGTLLGKINIQGAGIFGYSVGGIVGLRLAMRHPDVVGNLAILGSSAGSLRTVWERATYQQFLSLPADFAPPVLKDPYGRWRRRSQIGRYQSRKSRTLAGTSKDSPTNELTSIKAPTLIMQGATVSNRSMRLR